MVPPGSEAALPGFRGIDARFGGRLGRFARVAVASLGCVLAAAGGAMGRTPDAVRQAVEADQVVERLVETRDLEGEDLGGADLVVFAGLAELRVALGALEPTQSRIEALMGPFEVGDRPACGRG